ncbi:MAG: FkbM family methyltransferase, partial [Chloroflexota bacterium]|nr:FkbM family methyltransferase [Chloroflexota bacterium]
MKMLGILKQIPEALLKKYHRRVIYVPEGSISGVDFAHDLRVTIANPRPVCLDIGANEGQTITLLQRVFDDPTIHAFEPSHKLFQLLQSKNFGVRVSLHNVALGKEPAKREFINYEKSGLSSFLALDVHGEHPFRDVEVEAREVVEVETVDRFLQQNRIDTIDLLKIDTQGFDLEVLSGATGALQAGIIRNVLVELN